MPKNRKFFLVFLPFIFTILFITGWKLFSHKTSSLPNPIKVQVKDGQKSYERKIVDAKVGGELAVENTKVSFPANFTPNAVTASYRELATNKILASNSLSPMFELTAKTNTGASITKFDKPLQITEILSPDEVAKYKDVSQIAMYFFNPTSKLWEKLDSKFDPKTNTLIASTAHFTVFMAAGANPNTGITQTNSNPLIVDDGDPEPAFVPGGQTDPNQPEFWDFTGSGYNGSARFTGNSINDIPHNWATWKTENVTGNVEVFVTIPALSNKNLTKAATYVVTHSGIQTSVVINQSVNAGKNVSLGKFDFNGTASVYLNDVVPEKGQFFASYIVFDAISFGVPFDANLDITPPEITNVKIMADAGNFRIEAKVIDIGSGVKSVALYFNGQFYPMKLSSNNIYYLTLPYSKNANLDYYIVASDNAGNQSIWQKGKGYVTLGSFANQIGEYAGMQGKAGFSSSCNCGPKPQTGQLTPDPVDTATGNLIDKEKLLTVKGRPEIDLSLTYNSQSGFESIFGANWNYSYNYHLLEMDNPDFKGAFVQYPDGKIVKFSGTSFIPESGYFEKLTKTSDGYELIFKDLSKVKFDADGDIIRFEDPNKNGLNFSYNTKNQFTLLSQLVKITADGGRSVNFSYNQSGFVNQITAPENKILNFAYSNLDDLASITDARTNPLQFEYDSHNLTKKISPENYNLVTNIFDANHRVSHQVSGTSFIQDFDYQTGKVVVTDAHNFKTTYVFDSNNLLSSILDPKGNSLKYEYTANKQISKKTDQNANITTTNYDTNGNVVSQKDPAGFEITRTFDLNFNKPLTEIYKSSDHITKWEYDNDGNLTKTTNAKGNTSSFNYDSFGELSSTIDFAGHINSYTYDSAGDAQTVTDGEKNTQKFRFDNLGRVIEAETPRQFSYAYIYDTNDNLVEVDGPAGYKSANIYDKNNNLVQTSDANLNITSYSYDNSQNLRAVKDPLGLITKYEYGPMNELISKTSPENQVSKYEYDENYHLTKKTNAAGTPQEAITTFAYDPSGNRISITDPENHITKYAFDSLNHQTQIIKPQTNTTISFSYTPSGALQAVTDPNQNQTKYTLNALDEVISVTDAENEITSYIYDGQGNITEVKNPKGFITKYQFNSNNKLKQITDAKNNTTLYQYDPDKNLTSLTDPNNLVTNYEYNSLDQLSAKIQSGNIRTSYSYDPAGNITKIKNPRGFTTNLIYDADSRNIAITDPVGNSSNFVYDKVGNLIKSIDRNSHATSYVYDPLNRPVQITDPENYIEKLNYDRVGNEVSFINKNGFEFDNSYDELNRLKTAKDPYGKTKVLSYDANGNLLSLTDENSHAQNFTYDKVNRLKSSIDAENNLTQYSYDPNGNLAKSTDAENNATNYSYDELDRLSSQTNAENQTESYAYDKIDHILAETKADNSVDTYSYDPLYHLASVINNLKATTNYSYDANNNLTQITDPQNHTTNFSYDSLDRLIKESNSLGNTWSYDYDAEGNITNRTDANNIKTSYFYYPDNKLQEISYPTKKVDYKYSPTNLPVEMTDSLGITVWNYDKLDRLVGQKDPLNRTLQYEYDASGNLTKLTYPDGRNITDNYLKNNWLAKATTSDNNSVSYVLNKVGLPVQINRSNSSVSKYSYNKIYKPIEVVNDKDKFNYTYNKVGDITQEIFNGITSNFAYDETHRLTAVTASDGTANNYSYDPVGNRTSLTRKLKQGLELNNYSYNAANELTQIDTNSPLSSNNLTYKYQYDANGNRIDKLGDDKTGIDRGTHYSYDEENRLLIAQDYQTGGTTNQLAHTDMQYDGNGRRLVSSYFSGASDPGKRTEFTFNHLDPVAENNINTGEYTNFYRNPNQDLLMFQSFKSQQAPSGTQYWYSYDGRGNIAGTTKQNAQSDHTYNYDEYGKILPENGASGWTNPHNSYTLSQKAYDPNTNLYYFGARFYDAQTGTWMTQDPYRGQIQDPRTLNRYMYNNNSPINYVDKYGYCSSSFYSRFGCPSWLPDNTYEQIAGATLKTALNIFNFLNPKFLSPVPNLSVPTPSPNPYLPQEKIINGVSAKVLNVPYINQWLEPNGTNYPASGWMMCGAASSVMVAGYYGKLPYNTNDPHDLKKYMYSDSGQKIKETCGTDMGGAFGLTNLNCDENSREGVEDYFTHMGLHYNDSTIPWGSKDISLIKQAIDNGHPVTFAYEAPGFQHIVDIVGYTHDNKIVVNDPYTNTLKNGYKTWDVSYDSGRMVVYPLDMDDKFTTDYFIEVLP